MPEIKPREGFRLDGTIHLGHILVFAGMIGSVISLYVAFVAQHERYNFQLNNLEKIVAEQNIYNKAILEILNKLQVGQAITTDRLNRFDRTTPQHQSNEI